MNGHWAKAKRQAKRMASSTRKKQTAAAMFNHIRRGLGVPAK